MLIKYIVDAIKIIVMNFVGCRIVFNHKRDERIMERERSGRHFLNNCLLNMPSRNDLTLEQKVNLIKENERGSFYRILKEKFNVSVGSISNILKPSR